MSAASKFPSSRVHTFEFNYFAYIKFCLQHEDLESSLRDSGVLAQTQKTKDLEVRGKCKNIYNNA